ncbi:MAG: ABC transporter ATP-binding protein, partial [Pseudomonadota bacterium]
MTVSNGKRTRLTAELRTPEPARQKLTAGLVKRTAPPKADNTNTDADRLAARVDLLAVYAGLLGVQTARTDLTDDLCGRLTTDVHEPQTLAACLHATGLVAAAHDVAAPDPGLWPALAYMKSGQLVLVMGQDRGAVTLYDKTCPDNRADIPLAEFAPHFAGRVIKAEAPLERLAETHKTETRAPHWFWGEFRRFKGALGEIALGSFVANLLAVAVALFSLQVYDRVIPHQSQATLWVLAIGAGLALTLEALLKIARARMMDGAGRQIELRVLRLLMGRIMGMRSDIRGQAPSMTFSAMREFGSVREFFTASTIGTIADIPFIFVFLLLVASIAGPVVWVLILGGVLMVVPGFL